ncbi:hypothetical protein QFC19_003925 [Naganishia cerealis]|uniref:Uncharacterized protein n=1 Tax=Naganishia cerealis TaxID=610337 RepID=A0ACC2VZ80_9TREE|nr:hypothetical protein QFC19_003925 [Naganishia cerealis]
MAEQKRRQEADRVMRLVEAAPEKLTRAEKVAFEGKAAWKQSVESWRSGVSTAARSTEKGTRPSSNGSSSKRPDWDNEVSTTASSLNASRESSKVYFSARRPRYNRNSSSSPSPPSLEKPSEAAMRDRSIALEKLAGAAKPELNQCAAVPASLTAMEPSSREQMEYFPRITSQKFLESTTSLKHAAISASQFQPLPPASVSRETNADIVHTIQKPLVNQAAADAPAGAPIPTMMYGFHLPRPRAGRAYTMAASAANWNGTAGNLLTSGPRIDAHVQANNIRPFKISTSDQALQHVSQNSSTGPLNTRRSLPGTPLVSPMLQNLGPNRQPVLRP